jgi:hypothetical protein
LESNQRLEKCKKPIIFYLKEEIIMSKFAKRLAVGTVCATMVLGSTMSVFAAADNSGSVTSSGKMEGWVDKEIVSVVVPAANANTYAFNLDPQGLIVATQGNNAYSNGSTFSGSTGVYFTTATDTYTESSEKLTVVNKSSVDVDVTISAELKDATGIAISDATTFSGKDPALYLALVGQIDGDSDWTTSAVGTSTGKAELTTTLDDDDADYEFVYDTSTSSYKYSLKSSASTFPTYTFYLTGACNNTADADWSSVASVTPSLEITWDIVKHVDNVLTSDGTTDIVIYTGLTAAPSTITITPVTTTGSTKAALTAKNGEAYTFDATTGVLTLKGSMVKTWEGSRGTGTFSTTIGGKSYTLTFTS